MNSKTKDIPKAIIKGDIAYIPLCGKRGGMAVIDKDNAWIDKYRWFQSKNGYATANINYKVTYMHVLLFGVLKGYVNDHINRNKLDNRKENIRKTTTQINVRNTNIRSTNKSGYKGVQWYAVRNKWRAYIWLNYKMKTLGYFENKEDAIKARQEAETKYWED